MKLVVADSGQIEARVVVWLAGELAVLDTFRRNDATGGDFYSDLGSAFFLKKLSKKETPIERQLSKNMILGLGFGMGWKKFGGELLKGMLGSDPVKFGAAEVAKFGVDVTEFEQRPYMSQPCSSAVRDVLTYGVRLSYPDALIHFAVADHFVRVYRKKMARVPALWENMESALAVMAPPEGDPEQVRFDAGPVKILRHALLKPNGMKLHYPGLQRGENGYTYLGGKSGRERVKIYGGLLTENVVQSLARDIVAEQALWIRAEGYHVATMTHDEIVCVVPDDRAERCYAYMLERMRTPPAWCSTLPLNASGGIGQSYGAVK